MPQRVAQSVLLAVPVGGVEVIRERARGRKFNKALPEFGECVMYAKYLPKKGYNKLEAQWESGVYVGINDSSQELIIGTANGQ